MRFFWILNAGILLTMIMSSACSAGPQGAPPVTEVFSDSAVAALADAACRDKAALTLKRAKLVKNIDSQGDRGVTPLAWSVFCDSPKGVRVLLESGADPNQRSDEMPMVLIASNKYHPDILTALLEYGGDPNQANVERYNDYPLERAFKQARWHDDKTHYDILLKAGARYDMRRPTAWNNGTSDTFVEDIIKVYAALDEAYKLYSQGYNDTDLARLHLNITLTNGLSYKMKPYKKLFLEQVEADMREQGIEVPANTASD